MSELSGRRGARRVCRTGRQRSSVQERTGTAALQSEAASADSEA